MFGRGGFAFFLFFEAEEVFEGTGFAGLASGAFWGRGFAGGRGCGGAVFFPAGVDAFVVFAPGDFALLGLAGVAGDDAGEGVEALEVFGVGIGLWPLIAGDGVGFFGFGEVGGRVRRFGVAGEGAGELVGFVGAAAGDEDGAVWVGASLDEARAGSFEALVDGVDEAAGALAEAAACALEAAVFEGGSAEFGAEVVVGEFAVGDALAEGFVFLFGEEVDDAGLFGGELAAFDAVEHAVRELEDFEAVGDEVEGFADGLGDALEGPAGGAECVEGACAFEGQGREEGEVVGEGEGEFAVAAEVVFDAFGGDEDGDFGEAGLDGGCAASFAEEDAEAVAFRADEDGLEHAEFFEGCGEVVAGSGYFGAADAVARVEEGFGVQVGEAEFGGEGRWRGGVVADGECDAAAFGAAIVAADFGCHAGCAGGDEGLFVHLFNVAGRRRRGCCGGY